VKRDRVGCSMEIVVGHIEDGKQLGGLQVKQDGF
jgi:hypothetical protein